MSNQFLIPDPLDPDLLSPDVYHTAVSPALQVAAEVAAKRGDPTLHADMPSMLALVDLIKQLSALYKKRHDITQAQERSLANAPMAACVMVYQQAGLESYDMQKCLEALEAGYGQVMAADVLVDIRPQVDKAWVHLIEGRREKAHSGLYMSAMFIVAKIEDWLEKRYQAQQEKNF